VRKQLDSTHSDAVRDWLNPDPNPKPTPVLLVGGPHAHADERSSQEMSRATLISVWKSADET
jgi:hypothetical protein